MKRAMRITHWTAKIAERSREAKRASPRAAGTINKYALDVTAASDTKTYDGTTASTASPTITGGTSLQTGDTTTASITGSQTGISVVAAAATHIRVTAPANATVGVAFSITVTALDAYGNVATGYTGTVHFTSTDGAAVLPADYTFTGADAGVHNFSATFKTAGTESLAATERRSILKAPAGGHVGRKSRPLRTFNRAARHCLFCLNPSASSPD